MLIRSSPSRQRVFALRIQIKDQNDLLPQFLHLEQNVILNLCSDSLSRGISGELFRAVDGDLDNRVSVRLVGLDFLKVQTTGMRLHSPSDTTHLVDCDLILTHTHDVNGQSEAKSIDMGLTLMPSEIKYDYDRDYDGRVNASDGIYTNSTNIKIRVQSKCMEGIGFKKSVYRGIYEENSPNLRTDIILEMKNEKNLDSDQLRNLQFVLMDKQLNSLLSITSDTGEVALSQVLDFEQIQEVNAVVALQDTVDNIIYDMASVVIRVKDVNDNQPKINTTILSPAILDNGTGNILISEDTEPGVALVYIDTVDADRTSAGLVEISVTQLFGDYFTFQSGFILLARPLDREERHLLQLSIHTCDRGQPISCSQKLMSFAITDVNDNAPYFTTCPADWIEITENTEVGRKLITVVRASRPR